MSQKPVQNECHVPAYVSALYNEKEKSYTIDMGTSGTLIGKTYNIFQRFFLAIFGTPHTYITVSKGVQGGKHQLIRVWVPRKQLVETFKAFGIIAEKSLKIESKDIRKAYETFFKTNGLPKGPYSNLSDISSLDLRQVAQPTRGMASPVSTSTPAGPHPDPVPQASPQETLPPNEKASPVGTSFDAATPSVSQSQDTHGEKPTTDPVPQDSPQGTPTPPDAEPPPNSAVPKTTESFTSTSSDAEPHQVSVSQGTTERTQTPPDAELPPNRVTQDTTRGQVETVIASQNDSQQQPRDPNTVNRVVDELINVETNFQTNYFSLLSIADPIKEVIKKGSKHFGSTGQRRNALYQRATNMFQELEQEFSEMQTIGASILNELKESKKDPTKLQTLFSSPSFHQWIELLSKSVRQHKPRSELISQIKKEMTEKLKREETQKNKTPEFLDRQKQQEALLAQDKLNKKKQEALELTLKQLDDKIATLKSQPQSANESNPTEVNTLSILLGLKEIREKTLAQKRQNEAEQKQLKVTLDELDDKIDQVQHPLKRAFDMFTNSLIGPTQMIPRYKLLMERIWNEASKAKMEPEIVEKLKSAKDSVTKVVDDVNDSIRTPEARIDAIVNNLQTSSSQAQQTISTTIAQFERIERAAQILDPSYQKDDNNLSFGFSFLCVK